MAEFSLVVTGREQQEVELVRGADLTHWYTWSPRLDAQSFCGNFNVAGKI